jgi:outer membrane protein assembly factor BamB
VKRLTALLFVTAFAAAQGGGPKQNPVTDWQVEEKAARFSPAVRSGDAILYVVDGKRLVCRALEDGERRWEREISSRARPIARADKVWVGLDAFDVRSGDRAAVEGVEGHFDAPPSFSKDYCAAASIEGKLFLIELASGKLVGSVDVGPVRIGTTLVGARAYVVNDAGKVMAVAAKQGRKIWSVELGGPALSAPVRYGTQILIAVRDAIVVLEAKSGGEVGRIEARGLTTPLGTSKKILFYGTRDGVVVRVDADTRREMGRISVAKEPVIRALIAGGDLIYGVSGKRLFAVSGRTGSLVWTHEGKAEFSPPLATDGALFLAAGNVFYCLR